MSSRPGSSRGIERAVRAVRRGGGAVALATARGRTQASEGSVVPALRASPPAPGRHAGEAGAEEQERRGLGGLVGRDRNRPCEEPARGVQGGRGGRSDVPV